MPIRIDNSKHEAGIEGLRGFAALLVLYTHLLWPGSIDPHYEAWPGFMALEASQGAVLLFFILSGYVIGLSNHRPFTAHNWVEYLWRRIVRLVPICWIALALSELVRPGAGWKGLLGNALFLQNDIPYGTWAWPTIRSNTNLWTLNYEALFYLLFAVCWIRPQAWLMWSVTTFLLSIVLWLLPGNWAPLCSCYAIGWLFWLTGLGLARMKSDALSPAFAIPWISILLFWFVTWQEKPLWSLCHRLGLLPPESAAWINYTFVDIIPASVVLVLAASGRRPQFARALCSTSALIPLSFLSWNLIRGRVTLWPIGHVPIFCLVACALWKWRPDGKRVWGKLSSLGAISYGVYVLQRPVQWFVHDNAILPSGTAGAFILRIGIALALTLALAWVAESRLQPRLRHWLSKKHPVSEPVLAALADSGRPQ